MIEDVHTIVEAGREDVRAVVTRIVEVKRRFERRPGANKLALVEQCNSEHEMGDRQSDGIIRLSDCVTQAVHQLSCLLPIACNIGDPPQATEGMNQWRGPPEPFSQYARPVIDR